MNARPILPSTKLPASAASLLRYMPVMLAGLALFYGLLSLAHYWTAPANAQAAIDLHPGALPKYALFSLARIAIAYFISLVFAVAYGYVAAHSLKAERLMIPLLDTLQSIPVLSFLPGVMLSMVALFPSRQLGVELGSILLIFTGQVWNMAFSVYSSIRNLPREMVEAAQVYRLSWWQRFFELELPYSAIGLIWNSMMSVAGAWFFLMACEMFVLGNRDLRLPGLGSYLQSASNAGDTRAILWGLLAMIAVIVLLDQLVWRPVIAWSDKFKVEQVEAAQSTRSPLLDFLRRSRLLERLSRRTIQPLRESLAQHFVQRNSGQRSAGSAVKIWTLRIVALAAFGGLIYGIVRMVTMLAAISPGDLRTIFGGAGATFLRVELTLVLAGLWTIPFGVYVGLRPKLSAIAQPLAQVAASVPATALFPIVLLFLIRIGGGLQEGSVESLRRDVASERKY